MITLRIREGEQSQWSEMVERQLVIFLLLLYKHTHHQIVHHISPRERTRAIVKEKARTL